MAASKPPLPEGTDSIISDADADGLGEFTTAPTIPDTDATIAGDIAAAPQGTSGSSQGGYGGSQKASQASQDASSTGAKLGSAAAKVGEATAGLRAQATDKALGLAAQGKDRAIGLLDNVIRLVDDVAGQIEEKAGPQYGTYARQTSQAVSGFADTLREKDVEELVDDARVLIRKSPAIAIGAAAAIGFAVARVLKVGLTDGSTGSGADDGGTPPRTSTAPSTKSPATPTTATTMPVDPGY